MRRGSCVWGECERRWRMDYRFASVPCDEANIKISGRLPCHAGGFGAVDTTQGAPHNPARTWHPRDATFESGGVTRAAKGADCKSAGLRLRRFESYLPHHIEINNEIAKISALFGVVFLLHVLQKFLWNLNGPRKLGKILAAS